MLDLFPRVWSKHIVPPTVILIIPLVIRCIFMCGKFTLPIIVLKIFLPINICIVVCTCFFVLLSVLAQFSFLFWLCSSRLPSKASLLSNLQSRWASACQNLQWRRSIDWPLINCRRLPPQLQQVDGFFKHLKANPKTKFEVFSHQFNLYAKFTHVCALN